MEFPIVNDLWLRVIGISPERIPEGASRDFLWTNAPQSWGVFVMIAAVLAAALGIFYLYRREIASCPKPVRIVLAGLRTLVLLLLVTVALGPALVYSTRHRVDPVVVVALDDSASMKLADKYLDDEAVKPVAEATGVSASQYRAQPKLPTRLELVKGLFAKNDNEAVRELAGKGKLRVVHFSDRAEIKETKPRYVPPTPETEAEIAAKAAASADERTVLFPDLKWVFYASTVLVGVLLIVAYIRGSALLALIAAVPTVAAFFSLVIFLEANPRWHPLVLLEFDGVAKIAGYEITEPYKPEETPDVEEPPFDATIAEPTGAGRSTNLARVIRKVLEGSTGGAEVAALVLVTDGQHNAAEDYLAAADEAAERRVPILVLGVGDSSKERRIDVASVRANERVWRNDPFEIKALIQSKGYQGRAAKVTLHELEIGETGEGKIIEAKDVSLPADDGQETIVFKHAPQKEGDFNYIVKIETNDDGNLEGRREAKTVVTVVRDQAKVLLIAGSPTWEYRIVQVLLTRDKTIDLSCWLQTIKDMPQEGDTKLESMPLTKEDLAKYDVVLLFDPDYADFRNTGGTKWGDIIKSFVDNGGGLLYMPGPKHAGKFMTEEATSGIADVLPVRFDDPGALLQDYLSEKYNEPFSLDVVKANLDHPLLRFEADDTKTAQRWNAMPPMFWSFPAVEEKRGSKTLLYRTTGKGDRPLVVAGPPTTGRTVYLGMNGTWRWRRLGKDGDFFNRFWIQTVRYLVEGRLMGSQQRGSILVPNDEYPAGEKIKFTATLRTPQGEPFADATVPAELSLVEDKTPLARTTLKAIADKPGEYEGEFAAGVQGTNRISVELAGAKPGETVELKSRNFRVESVDIELQNRRLNKAVLTDIAERSSGQYKGAYFDVNQMANLTAAVPNRGTEKVVPGRPIDLWDTNRLIFVLALLLTIEWGARKRFKLM
jgi:uncharacterized membrane protein